MTPKTDIRPDAHHLVDQLPDNASWDDLRYQIYVRQAIDRGIADADAGRMIPHEEVLRRVLGPQSK